LEAKTVLVKAQRQNAIFLTCVMGFSRE